MTQTTTAANGAIVRIETLAHEALELELHYLRQAQRYEAAGLVRTAQASRRWAAEARGKAEAFDIATAIVAGTFK